MTGDGDGVGSKRPAPADAATLFKRGPKAMRVVHQPGDATTGADDRDGEGKVRRGSDVARTGQSNSSRDGSLASHPRLAARLRALCSALERPAGAHPNNLSIARWHATNDTKLPYVAELVRTRGKHFTKFGHVCGARTYLLPEEVLFLVETERLAVVAPRKKGKGAAEETHRCFHCQTESTKMMCCSQCHRAWYCGRPCQKKHWKLHKRACVAAVAGEAAAVAVAVSAARISVTTSRLVSMMS